MNVASGVLSELMSAKIEISKDRFAMFTNITVRFKLQSIVWVLFLKFYTNYNSQFFATHIEIQIPNKYLGFGYKGIVFSENNVHLLSFLNVLYI